MKRILFLFVIAMMFAWTSVSCAGSKKSDGFQQISSPNGRVSVKVTDGYFVVLYDDVEVQTVRIENGTFKDCYFTKEPKENNYSLISGKRSECSYSYNQMFYVGENGTPIPINITFSVTDNGVAFSFNGSDESIAYVIPDGTKRWMQPLKTDYEGFYPMSTSAKNGKYGYPALIEYGNGVFGLITESGIKHGNSCSYLDCKGQEYTLTYTDQDSGSPHPWRIIMVGSLADIVESTMVTDFSEKCMI